MKKIGLIGLIGLIGVFWGGREARAQSLSLSISPPILEVMIKPGKSITQIYKLTNTGEPVVITPKLFELGFDGIKEDTEFTKDKWISIVSNDIDFDKAFLLGSNKEAEFLVKISPGEGTTEQDYYRAIVFSTTPNPQTDSTMTSFAQNLASPLLITVTSNALFAKAAQITKFEIPEILDSFDALTVDIDIKNSGNVYFRPLGKISLSGLVGKGSYNLVPGAFLSGQSKQLLTEHLPPSPLPLRTLYLPGFYLGKYQLNLDFTAGEGNTTITQAKTFYAIPWKLSMVVLVFVLIIAMMRRRKKVK